MNIEKVEKSVENVISKEIDVEVMSFNELTNLDYPLMIDNYQRPYVWTVDKLNQLLNDLIDFRSENESLDIPYYMGSILLHKSDNSKGLFGIFLQILFNLLINRLFYDAAYNKIKPETENTGVWMIIKNL